MFNDYYSSTIVIKRIFRFYTAKGFIQCKLSDENFDECLRNAIQVSLPHLANGKNKQPRGTHLFSLCIILLLFNRNLGVPSLGINQIDPMLISRLNIHQSNGPVNIKLSFNDIYIHNIKHAVIDKSQ